MAKTIALPKKPWDHTWILSCGKEDCGGGCPLCTLGVCDVCGLYEGGLTTHCPGVSAIAKSTDIYDGKLDFVRGSWVGECSPHSPHFARMSADDVIKKHGLPEPKYDLILSDLGIGDCFAFRPAGGSVEIALIIVDMDDIGYVCSVGGPMTTVPFFTKVRLISQTEFLKREVRFAGR